MANTLKLKSSSVAGKVPTTSELAMRELALNVNDGLLFLKRSTSGNETGAGTSIVQLFPATGGAITGDVTLNAQSDLRFADSDSSNWVAFQGAATISSNVTWTLPSADATSSGQVLSSNAAGTLSWITPSGSGDVTLAGNNAMTGANTFYNATGQTIGTGTSTQDGIILKGRAGGSTSLRVSIEPGTLTASRTLTLPDATTTVVGTDATQTLTNKTLTDPAIIGTILEDIFTISDGAAFEVDPGNGSIQLITLGASRTPKATNFLAGESVTLMVDDGTAYTLTWTDTTWGTSGVKWVGGTAPTLATTGYTVIEFWKVSTQVYGARVGNA